MCDVHLKFLLVFLHFAGSEDPQLQIPNLFLHCLNCTRSQGNNEKVAFVFGCCSLWKSFMKNKCFDSSLTRSRLQTNKYPKQNRINVFYQIYCFTRQQNKWCCLYACEKIVCNQDIFNETKCPRSASFISDQAIWPRQLSNHRQTKFLSTNEFTEVFHEALVPKVSNIFGIFLCILFQLPLHQNILNWQLELLLERPFSSFYPVGNYQFQIDGHLTKLLRIIKNLGWNSVEYFFRIFFLD